MYLFHTNLFSLIGQDWVQNNYIPCCFSNIRGDGTVDREVWASIRGLLWVEPLACRIRAFRARQDGLRLYGDSQLIKHINICYLVASQPPYKAGKWTDLSLLVKEKTESSERLENYSKSHSYEGRAEFIPRSWASWPTATFGFWVACLGSTIKLYHSFISPLSMHNRQ